MKIAILGAGFCGLAAAWHLIQKDPRIKIEIFDAKGIGGGASGIAAGLLHPYGGAHAKLNWMGVEGFQATKALLTVSSQALGRPVFDHQGILRLALTEDQKTDFLRASRLYDDIEWLDLEKCQALVPGLNEVPGILIHTGISIYSKQYLEGLWRASKNEGATLTIQAITSLNDFNHFDAVVIAMGAGFCHFPEAKQLSLNQIKGQVLELAWPESLKPLALPLNSHAYLLMNENQQTCLAGATFERDFINAAPDPSFAKQDIMPKIEAYYPSLAKAEIIGCQAGLRVSAPNHRPIAKHLKDNLWVMTGMGSKGLLYHALMAKQLAEAIYSL